MPKIDQYKTLFSRSGERVGERSNAGVSKITKRTVGWLN